MTKSKIEYVFTNPIIIGFFITIFLVLVVMSTVFQFWNPFAPSGHVVGEFINADHRGFGDFCGQYPFTKIILNNYSVVGEIDDWDNVFYFGNQYSKVDDLRTGQHITIYYHQESRPSDTTSGDMIYYWVIDNIN